MFGVDKEMWKVYIVAGEPSYLRTRVSPSLNWIWAGRYAEFEKNLRAVLEVVASLQDQEYQCWKTRDLALCLALQGKCIEALAMAEEGLSLAHSIGELDVSLALSLYGITCLKCGKLNRAEENLSQSFTGAPKLVDAHHEIGFLYLATIYEVLKDYEKAQYFYQLAQTEAHRLGHNYFECGALAGMTRVKHAQNNYTVIAPLWSEAEQLAQQYEYNDHFTSLYLTRGHLIWDNLLPEWESGFDLAFHYYQLALIHALRFNRFLLDEALSERGQGTALDPIILNSIERGEEGQRMLVALREWWQNGTNNIGVPRPDTISPVPEGISLIEAERMARNREPGDGSQQRDVVEQINAALAMVDEG
jgi:tetratricopeptide (TPR) repeat protein